MPHGNWADSPSVGCITLTLSWLYMLCRHCMKRPTIPISSNTQVPTGSGVAFISQVPDFVSEMDLFWYVPTNETTCSRTFRKREKVTYSGEHPL